MRTYRERTYFPDQLDLAGVSQRARAQYQRPCEAGELRETAPTANLISARYNEAHCDDFT